MRQQFLSFFVVTKSKIPLELNNNNKTNHYKTTTKSLKSMLKNLNGNNMLYQT